MQIRKVIIVSIWIRLGIVFLCFALLYMNRVLGQKYFNPSIALDEQRRSVVETIDVDVRNDLGLTGLMFAAIYGEIGLARALIAQGAHINAVSRDELNTAVHFAMNNMRSMGSREVGIFLVDAYANMRMKNKYGDTPLHLTISTDIDNDWAEMVDRLIKNGADINAQTNQGDTLLHLAVNLQRRTWVQWLLDKYGSLLNMEIRNKKGLTPYQYALQLGFSDLAEVFQQPIVVITKAGMRDANGLTGLMLAVMRGDRDVVREMVKDKNALNELSNDSYRNSALHMAVLCEQVPMVALLLNAGASRVIKNSRGEIPLQFLVRMSDEKKMIEMAKLLLKEAPETLAMQNDRGETMLHYIVRFDAQRLLDYLLKSYDRYLAPQLKNKALQTPSDLASYLRRSAIKRLLPSAP